MVERLNLSSASGFSFDVSKLLSSGKELNPLQQLNSNYLIVINTDSDGSELILNQTTKFRTVRKWKDLQTTT